MQDLETKKAIERLERKVDMLLKEKRKETIVPASVIMELTGWNKEGMRRARKRGLVKQIKDKNTISYVLESVPNILIKKTA